LSYFEIGIYAPIHNENIGTLWRSAYQLGAAGIFTIGKLRRNQTSDTAKTRMEIPFRSYPTWDDFLQHRPTGARIIGIEMGGKNLATFQHPDQALYLLGSEANGLPKHIQEQCDDLISLESVRDASYNVAVTGSIVLYHRFLTKSGG
jgi:tRNA G18 (ribose-2'-O)-methylase SpoU